MKVLLKYAIKWTEDVALMVCAGDLIYLYYAGAWGDPIRAVELTELVGLWATILFALWRLIAHIKEAAHEQSNKS